MQDTEEINGEYNPVQEALDNFDALLRDAAFDAELELMGIGRLQFVLRRQMTREFTSLYIALWRLALASSFPNDADAMFATFLHGYLLRHPDRAGRNIANRAREYWDMILPGGDSDFTAIARHLISFLSAMGDSAERALTLKLALHLRGIYRFLFERLI